MKTFDLNSLGLQEMTTLEMKETDGGFVLLLCAAAALLLLGGCTININNQVGNNNTNTTNAETKVDSTGNGNTLEVPLIQ